MVLIVFVQLLFQSFAFELFTVELEKREYDSPFGGEVQMGCRFQPIPKNASSNLQLSWHWITPDTEREVYRLVDGEEHLPPANSHYQGRVSFLIEELSQGWAKLKLSSLQINDSGIYQCLVQSENVADYKEMALSVTAQYDNVTKLIQPYNKDQVQLTCESKGYPVSRISWTDSKQQSLVASTFNKTTPDQLIQVVSHALVSLSQRNTYTCHFERGSSATFLIPGDLLTDRMRYTGIFICVALLLITVTGMIFYARCVNESKKRLSGPTGENVVFTSSKRDSLRRLLKEHYNNMDLVTGLDSEPMVLDRHGQTVPLSSIWGVGEPGETVLLVGPPGSGKTSLVHILVTSWMSDTDCSDVSHLLWIDASVTEGDLLGTVESQLPVSDVETSEELKHVMTSSACFLVLDGYVEGNSEFDPSLISFVNEKRESRLLVTSRPDQCPTLKTTVPSENILTLEKL
ncbi:uncharacterized protein ACB058_004166 [Synchiropus picturatus]